RSPSITAAGVRRAGPSMRESAENATRRMTSAGTSQRPGRWAAASSTVLARSPSIASPGGPEAGIDRASCRAEVLHLLIPRIGEVFAAQEDRYALRHIIGGEEVEPGIGREPVLLMRGRIARVDEDERRGDDEARRGRQREADARGVLRPAGESQAGAEIEG